MRSSLLVKSPPFPSRLATRRTFLRNGGTAVLSALLIKPRALAAEQEFRLPLSDSTRLNIEGPHRFRTISGMTGLQATSLHTRATVVTRLHHRPEGALSFWFSSLEAADFYSMHERVLGIVPDAMTFPLVSDAEPPRARDSMTFGVYWTGGYPQLVGKFAQGGIFARLDHGLAPFVYAERLPLRAGAWYHVVLCWDKPQGRLQLHVNGRRMGYSEAVENFGTAGEKLIIGNPMVVMRDLRIEPAIPSEREIQARYLAQRPPSNGQADEDIRLAVDIVERPPLDLRRDAAWREAYATDFTRPQDVAAWTFQTGDQHRTEFRVESTAEGLLIGTPKNISLESRMYLWSPRNFEGDQWIEFDFRLESPEGLSLLAACCRGPQREDFLQDRPMEKTGAMNVILSKTLNYHWEFMRRVELMRRDVETQYLAKNPWGWKMHYGCIPRLEQGRWHRLRFVKAGHRIHGSINSRTVFDITEDPTRATGPGLNFGRIGLRQMYKTTMRYRAFSVFERQLT